MAGTVWHFAYGSSMSRAQMKSRAGQILEEKPGRLENHELVFNKKARGGSAQANIRSAPGKTVFGVLYKIPDSALRHLDRFEGVPQHYRRIEVGATDNDGNRIGAQAYVAARIEGGLRPAAHYLQTILTGADEHGLPADYIAEIKAAAGSA